MPKTIDNLGKECHDCGQYGPEWCSMNHGVLLCDECCSVHLSLGRHISQIKSFKRSSWPPTQLNLIYELTSNGANLIWEYSLRDPQNKLPKKKPSAKDSLPVKAEFIRMKYQQMAYINRLKDETNGTLEDLNLQLHSIVRTDNVVTCLRFLSQGADPNFRNPETGTSSIHVAASRGQMNQIELLCIFGGDPGIVDAAGISPEEHARTNNYLDLADRLIELQYELTDRLVCFIGGKRTDHKTHPHIVLPEHQQNLNKSEQTFIAQQKLQQLPDGLFEELAMDVFDEVERRELKTIWHAQVDKALIPLHVVPFLPVNPSFSATRNQGRQKLARYGATEFNTFIYDILSEVCRRYHDYIHQSPTTTSPTKVLALPRQNNEMSTAMINAFIDSDEDDDGNFYDKVASDEEYSSLTHQEQQQQKRSRMHRKLKKSTKDQAMNGSTPNETSNLSDNATAETHNRSDDLKARITSTEIQVKYLACAHIDLKNELAVLHQMIQRLLDENLLNKIDQQVSPSTTTSNNGIGRIPTKSTQHLFDDFSRKSSPFLESDYDNTTLIEDPENSRSMLLTHDIRASRSIHRFPQIDENPTIHYPSYHTTDFISNDIPMPTSPKSNQQSNKREIPITINRSRSYSGGRKPTTSPPALTRKGSCNQVETNSNIDRCTQKIAQRVADFFTLIKDNPSNRYVIYAERINDCVQEMLHFSERMRFNDDIRANIDLLKTSTQQLLVHAALKEKHPTMQSQFLIDDCYSIALATRNLLSLYQKF